MIIYIKYTGRDDDFTANGYDRLHPRAVVVPHGGAELPALAQVVVTGDALHGLAVGESVIKC